MRRKQNQVISSTLPQNVSHECKCEEAIKRKNIQSDDHFIIQLARTPERQHYER